MTKRTQTDAQTHGQTDRQTSRQTDCLMSPAHGRWRDPCIHVINRFFKKRLAETNPLYSMYL